jgi:putative salt-induced outer membrane protein YdiY
VIKGEMITMQNDLMSFESDKFDNLEIDWDDVIALRLAKPRIFRLRGRRIYIGMGEVREGKIHIVTPKDGPLEFPASEVLSIVFTREAELRNWRLQIGANLAARSGNTDQADLTSNAKLQRQTPFTRWTTRYTGTFSQTEGDRTANNHRLTTRFDVQMKERFFLTVPSFEFFQDEFQNIDQRYTPGIGLGYDAIDIPLLEWRLTLGPAVQITEFDSGERDEDAAVLFGSELSFNFPRDIDLDLSYQLQLIATDLGKTSHSTSAILSIEIWGPLDLDVGGYMDRIERPERDNDGRRPNRNDFRLTVGLSLDL